jgi:hypothetical protein
MLRQSDAPHSLSIYEQPNQTMERTYRPPCIYPLLRDKLLTAIHARSRRLSLIFVSLDGIVSMGMILVVVPSRRGHGGLPCALVGDILCLSRVRRHPVTTNKPTT